MKGISSIYLGRHVSKENFRVFVYEPAGSKKLVESWDEYEAAMASGLWFATAEECQVKKRNKKTNRPIEKEIDSVVTGMFEKAVKKGVLGEIQDDFLPKASD